MKQIKIDNTPIYVRKADDGDQYVAWTGDGDVFFAYGVTEQQALEALRVKMFGCELSPEAEQVYEDFLAGRISPDDFEDEVEDEDAQLIELIKSRRKARAQRPIVESFGRPLKENQWKPRG